MSAFHIDVFLLFWNYKRAEMNFHHWVMSRDEVEQNQARRKQKRKRKKEKIREKEKRKRTKQRTIQFHLG